MDWMLDAVYFCMGTAVGGLLVAAYSHERFDQTKKMLEEVRQLLVEGNATEARTAKNLAETQAFLDEIRSINGQIQQTH